MSQVIFNIGDGLTLIKHIDGAGMSESVNGMEVFEAFGGNCLGDVFFADTIDAVAGKLLSPLIDKKAVPIEWFWTAAVLSHIAVDELSSLRPKFYEAIPISFAKDGKGIFLRIKVVVIEGCDLTCSCA